MPTTPSAQYSLNHPPGDRAQARDAGPCRLGDRGRRRRDRVGRPRRGLGRAARPRLGLSGARIFRAEAIAHIVTDAELREDYIIPSVFNRDVAPAVADAVAREAKASGAAQAQEHTIGFAAIDAERMRSAS